jgi:hypothetical protein
MRHIRVIEVKRSYLESPDGFMAPTGWDIRSIEYIGLNTFRLILVAL